MLLWFKNVSTAFKQWIKTVSLILIWENVTVVLTYFAIKLNTDPRQSDMVN